jgi:DNA-binding transcriptional MerR regulator
MAAHFSTRDLAYEELGFIEPVTKKKMGKSFYGHASLLFLQRIQVLKEAGCSLKEIEGVLNSLKKKRVKGKQQTVYLRHTLKTVFKKVDEREKSIKKIKKNIKAVLQETADCDTCKADPSGNNCRRCNKLDTLMSLGVKGES